jgi:acylphosphatase
MSNPAMSQEQIHAHVFISGRVQGVGYRYSTLQQAQQLGVSGWVRNLPDGRVEAIFEGNQNIVEEMINWCRKGPSGSVVQAVKVEYEALENLQGFKISK